MRLIGLSGAARSGKDTVGSFLVKELDFKRYAFADPLKECASKMFGLPLKDFYEGDREKVNEFWGFSPRQMLQLLGTEGGRNIFGYDLWTKRAEIEWKNHIHSFANPSGFMEPIGEAGMVITDVRFQNEAQFVHNMGGIVIHIERQGADGIVGVSNHASEAGFPDHLKNYVITNDGTLEQLYSNIKFVLELQAEKELV